MRIHKVGTTLRGDYTRYRMRISAKTLETVETERAIHGGSRERKGTTAGEYIWKGLRMKVRTWLYCL